jgi:hypothetical protein
MRDQFISSAKRPVADWVPCMPVPLGIKTMAEEVSDLPLSACGISIPPHQPLQARSTLPFDRLPDRDYGRS